MTMPGDSLPLELQKAGDSPHSNGSFAEGGFEPLTIGSMCKNLTTDSYHETSNTLEMCPYQYVN